MANLKPQHYRLLAGPYRMAVWAILARFKAEFVAKVMQGVAGLSKATRRNIATSGLVSLRQELERFEGDADTYRALLARAIEKLQVDARQQPRARASAGKPARLADQRCDQIRTYLEGLVEVWERLETDGEIADALQAFAQVLWPYYCVAFPRAQKSNAIGSGIKFNFCTWVADSTTLANSCFPSTGFGSFRQNTASDRPVVKLRLMPSLDDCFDVEENSEFRDLIDRASELLLDFEDVEANLGHVQELNEPADTMRATLDILRCMIDPITDPGDPGQIEIGLKESSAAFTDLFQFTNQALRYVINAGEVEDSKDVTPFGVLFLGSPSLEAVRAFLAPLDMNLEDAVREAWERAGGLGFTRNFHADFQSLRDQFKDLDRSARADAAGDLSHHSKNILNNIAQLIRAAQRRGNTDAGRREALRQAEYSARYVGQEFGLQDRIRNVLRSSGNTRSILETISDDQLADLVEIQIRQLLTFRQEIDAEFRRHYSLNGKPIDTRTNGIDAVAATMRDHLATIYESRGEPDDFIRAQRLRSDVDSGIDRDAIALTIFFICREMIDNVRPRVKLSEGTKLDISISPVTHGPRGWRALDLVQTLSKFDGEAPFEGAAESESIARFNDRHGPEGTDSTLLAMIQNHEPWENVSPRQHCFKQTLLLPDK